MTDFWLQAIDPTEQLCLGANAIVADSITNSAGRTTFSGPVIGGGCAVHGLYLRAQGIVIVEYPGCIETEVRDIIIVSHDLNADCRIDLSDLAAFGLSYNKSRWVDPDFNTCCDYNDDDKCNLSDFAWFAEHYLHGDF